jgi:hypothetical protein
VRTFTNKDAHWRGNTQVYTVRLMAPVAEVVDSMVGTPGLKDRSAVLQHLISLGVMVTEGRDRRNGHGQVRLELE